MRFGYTRVSTVAQMLHHQHDSLKPAGASKMYSDTMSGARDLAALMDQLRAGDTVVVWKLNRLGRDMLHVLDTVKGLTEMGVTLVSTSDGIDSSTAAGRMIIGELGSLADYERELGNERTALKRAASRASGTKFGLPRKVDDAKHIATATRMTADGHTGKDIAKCLGVSRAMLYRYLAWDTAARWRSRMAQATVLSLVHLLAGTKRPINRGAERADASTDGRPAGFDLVTDNVATGRCRRG